MMRACSIAIAAALMLGAIETHGAKFCPQCGVKLSTRSNCPKCSAEISPGAHFCPGFGEKLG